MSDADDGQTRDDDSGQYGQDYADSDFLARLWDAEPLSTVEVAEAVGCAKKTAYSRLLTLESDGRVTKRSVGQAYLWSLSESERERHTD
jgi:predicted transcriptional regulator